MDDADKRKIVKKWKETGMYQYIPEEERREMETSSTKNCKKEDMKYRKMVYSGNNNRTSNNRTSNNRAYRDELDSLVEKDRNGNWIMPDLFKELGYSKELFEQIMTSNRAGSKERRETYAGYLKNPAWILSRSAYANRNNPYFVPEYIREQQEYTWGHFGRLVKNSILYIIFMFVASFLIYVTVFAIVSKRNERSTATSQTLRIKDVSQDKSPIIGN